MLERIFFMQIHTGAKVIGWLWSVLSFLMLALLTIAVKKTESIDDIFRLTLFVAFFLFLLITSVLLIVGIKKNSHVLLLPWLISFGCFLVLTYLTIVIILYDIVKHRAGYVSEYVTEVVLCLILALSSYMYFGIFSLYKHLKSIPVATSDPEASLSK